MCISESPFREQYILVILVCQGDITVGINEWMLGSYASDMSEYVEFMGKFNNFSYLYT